MEAPGEEGVHRDMGASGPETLVLTPETSKRVFTVDEVVYPTDPLFRLSSSRIRTSKTINALPDDVLLDVFRHCWSTVDDVDEDVHWSQRWFTLALVCQKWNRVISASSHRLGFQLWFSFGSPVADLIKCSPPFPLVLDYRPRFDDEEWAFSDVDGVLFALQHLQRARQVVLSAPASTLETLTGTMAGPAPILQRLELESQTTDFVLPMRILDMHAPQLRHLSLSGCVLPSLHPLLSTTPFLVSLTLHRIPSSASFSPDCLASCIRSMPRLQTLSLSFLSAEPPSALKRRNHSPIQSTSSAFSSELTELLVLRQLIYRGPSTYLDAFLANFRSAPFMRKLHLTLFNQLSFSIPHIASFIHASSISDSSTLALIDLYESSAWLTMIPACPITAQRRRRYNLDHHHSEQGHYDDDEIEVSIRIRIPCERLDFQLSALAAICSALACTLDPITELMISHYAPPDLLSHPLQQQSQQQLEQQPSTHDTVDASLWLELIAPFQAVRTLRVDPVLDAELSRALVHSVGAAVECRGANEEEVEVEVEESRRMLLLPALRTVEHIYRVKNSENDPKLAKPAFGSRP